MNGEQKVLFRILGREIFKMWEIYQMYFYSLILLMEESTSDYPQIYYLHMIKSRQWGK